MISVITCSRSPQLFSSLAANITSTIGVPFELIKIDNTNRTYSLCEAYNKGAIKAKYEYLCFIHEDVSVLSNNWGKTAADICEKNFDLIGVAGSKYKSKMISGWTTGNSNLDYYNVYHKQSDNSNSHYFSNASGEHVTECVVLDGVWLFCKKSLWEKVKFNEDLFKGFHFYDVDFSMRCNNMGKVGVTFDIDILHYSAGKFTDTWMKEAVKFHRFYKTRLPVSNIPLESADKKKFEKQVYLFWVKRLQKESLSKTSRNIFKLHALSILPKLVIKKTLYS